MKMAKSDKQILDELERKLQKMDNDKFLQENQELISEVEDTLKDKIKIPKF